MITLLLLIFSVANGQEQCSSKTNCNDCIQQFGCEWCSEPGDFVHCYQTRTAAQNGCPANKIISPQSYERILSNNPIQSQAQEKPVQIKPQVVNITLRVGEQYKLKFDFAQAANFPIDLYYIMDLSSSMEAHKKNLAKLGKKLIDTMRNTTSDFQIGFGSFVEKTEMPFVSTHPVRLVNPCNLGAKCTKAYAYKNEQSLNNGSNFAKQVENAWVSGNLDVPEAGFDALMQAMVCPEVIGWRKNAFKIIVFSTDAIFHIAGDGKLAGVIEPNDAKCHMENNEYTHQLIYDYPSISHINYIAKRRGINIFFAIVENTKYNTYNNLINYIENSDITPLRSDSNMPELIANFYRKIADTIKISDNTENTNLQITYTSNCASPIENGCKNVHVGEIINFEAIISAFDCSQRFHQIEIKPGTYDEVLRVNLEIICDCNCSPSNETQTKAECGDNGDLVCGICSCHNGFYGRTCECNGENDSNDSKECIQENSDKICSGLGTCKCGVCDCDKRQNPSQIIYGKFCQCDNYSCPKNIEICSGNGNCDCGKCKCFAGWTGEICECPSNNGTCTTKGEVCSNHGECVCGKCKCDNEYYGLYCEECATCSGYRCEELKPCVEAAAYNLKEVDDDICLDVDITTVEKILEDDSDFVKICRLKSGDNCIVTFNYRQNENQKFIIQAEKELKCVTPINVLALVLYVIGSILLAGILMLIIWKVCTTYHDKREYSKFETERENAKWNRSDNPLFRTPVSKFENPMYGVRRSIRKSLKL